MTYQIVGLGNDYLTAGKALNNASNLVKAVGGATGCASLTAVGGVGTYYAGAISAAQAALPSNGNQNVIILVSDGDASSNKMGTLNTKQQCQQAVTAAAAATTAPTAAPAATTLAERSPARASPARHPRGSWRHGRH